MVALVIFGSVGRETPRSDSDIDFLLVVENLPNGRMARSAEFRVVESSLVPDLAELVKSGLHVELSPIFKSPAEVEQGSLLFLDMIYDARILYDRNNFFQGHLQEFLARLNRLGARRIWVGNAWYWDLKPDYQQGEVFEI